MNGLTSCVLLVLLVPGFEGSAHPNRISKSHYSPGFVHCSGQVSLNPWKEVHLGVASKKSSANGQGL